MKKVLITGNNSYIGTSFKKWISQYPEKYEVHSISVRDNRWKEMSFSGYDVILHTAAVVHVHERNKSNYLKVNRDLTIKLAKKAKRDGVNQFIFLSTMGVYGKESGRITRSTAPNPKTAYAQSKYEAEKHLLEIESNDFIVTILRPPLVYGRECPGNYARLANIAKKLPVFPIINNQRSMIYIDNLSEFIRLSIDNKLSGTYFPQNNDYVNTTELVLLIADVHNKNIKTTNLFNWVIKIGLNFSETLRKVFGSYTYDRNMPGSSGLLLNREKIEYDTVSFVDSILYTEGREQD